jgi:hypothetical protein
MVGGNGTPGSQHGPLDFTVLGIPTANFNANSLGYFSRLTSFDFPMGLRVLLLPAP